MNIITTRRIIQVFFFILFIWFCVVATLGENWWQLRGWPVNWFLQLDPLVGIGTMLTTQTLYAGLLWGAVTIALTLFLGRFFCGWLCPMGALQQFIGYLGLKGRKGEQKIACNQPHPAQRIKYWLLIYLLFAAAVDLFRSPSGGISKWVLLGCLLSLIAGALVLRKSYRNKTKFLIIVVSLLILVLIWHSGVFESPWLSASLQIGLFDPICLIQRMTNLIILPLVDGSVHLTATRPRFYAEAGIIGVLFLSIILLCLRFPRFYCRFICPLGALLGLLSRWSVWRMGKLEDNCKGCRQCEKNCEGACSPSGTIQISECVLCLNCMDPCRHNYMGYRTQPSSTGEQAGPDLSRRYVVSSMAAGLLTFPMIRISGGLEGDWSPLLIRPPGALAENEFLARCIKCGQCMRICPTNVIHPSGWQNGVEGLWTPTLNFRMGTSGCQHNCIACSHVCPTAALRPLTIDERMGRNAFADRGPLRTGMAFVDHGRCLPWTMDTPCVVCQENCPVSPKAIFTRTLYQPIRDGLTAVRRIKGPDLEVDGLLTGSRRLDSGDYFVSPHGDREVLWPIIKQKGQVLTLGSEIKSKRAFLPGKKIQISVRLQRPYVDPHRCIGCGVCEHECPVHGRRAIRITAENETRNKKHLLVIS